MPEALKWDQTGEKLYETGVEQVALFVQDANGAYPKGVAWNGVTAVNESPSGADETALYANDTKYLGLRAKEDYGSTIEAYTYPDEFEQCDGSAEVATGVTIGQQARKPFGLAYKTLIGNDTEGESQGYKLQLVYNATASPSEKSHSTINESPEAVTMSWEVTTTPLPIPGFKPSSQMTINSTKVDHDKLVAFEKIVYGSTEAEARLPLPAEVIQHFGASVNP
jgi:hypothetical protein